MINIRANAFETNSSSVHTICITDEDIYKQWVEGKLYYNNCSYSEDPDFVSYEEAKELDPDFPYPQPENEDDWEDWEFKDDNGYWHEKTFLTFEQFFQNYDWEHFNRTYTTNNGDTVHAFGYYGHD